MVRIDGERKKQKGDRGSRSQDQETQALGRHYNFRKTAMGLVSAKGPKQQPNSHGKARKELPRGRPTPESESRLHPALQRSSRFRPQKSKQSKVTRPGKVTCIPINKKDDIIYHPHPPSSTFTVMPTIIMTIIAINYRILLQIYMGSLR